MEGCNGATSPIAAQDDDVVYLGQEKDGYVKVQASAGEGWLRKALVTK